METKQMDESVGLGAVTDTSGVGNIFCLCSPKDWNPLLQSAHRGAAARYLIGVKIPEIAKKGEKKMDCESPSWLCLRDSCRRNNCWVLLASFTNEPTHSNRGSS